MKSWKPKFWNRGKYKWNRGKYKWSWYLNEIVHLNWHLVNDVKQCYLKVYQSIIVLRNFVKLTGKHLCQSLKKRDSGTGIFLWMLRNLLDWLFKWTVRRTRSLLVYSWVSGGWGAGAAVSPQVGPGQSPGVRIGGDTPWTIFLHMATKQGN